MNVIKRDGSKVPFNSEKIYLALYAANEDLFDIIPEESISDENLWAITNRVVELIENLNKECSVEEIQDIVEAELVARNSYFLARTYIRYRYKKEIARNAREDFFDALKGKLEAKDVQNQNANMDEKSFSGRMGEANSYMTKQLALDEILSKKSRENHEGNRIYIHDLDHYYIGDHNCLSVPIDKLLAEGFNTRQMDIRPAGSVQTAFQLVAVIFQLQSLVQFGGVSATHLDWSMVPYVRKSFAKHYKDGCKYLYGENIDRNIDWSIEDERYIIGYEKAYEYAMDMTEKETYQAVEAMYHNLNTLQSRSGGQLPFSSINYGTCTLPEGRMVTKAILDVSIKGLGRLHRTSIFPCGIFQMMKGVNRKPGDPNYDLYRLALKSTALRLYPNYANVDWSNNAGYDVNDPKTYFSTMGCRTANGADINAEPGTNPQTKDGRGNICPMTIIMPELAMEAVDDSYKATPQADVIENFMGLLQDAIYDARDMLLERYRWICSQSPDSARFMYENGTMLGYHPEEGIESALKHGTLVIGQLGLAETLQILIGKDHTTPEGMELAKRIEQLFKDRCAQFKQEEHLNFGVYYTPAENLCYTAMKKFKEKWGEIPNVSDRDYFTNSIHVPVWIEMSPFEKIDIEAQLTGYSNAGCITYVELDSGMENNIDGMEQIVNYAMDNDVPYFAINVPNDTCLECGHTGEFNDHCPECDSEIIQQLRRVTGYLTGNYTTAFNYGKQKETEDRVKHI